jgi:hypothetical protein
VFKGNPRDAAQVTALTGAMRQLETAYIAYRRKLDSTSGLEGATEELAATLEQVKSQTLSVHE